MLQSELVLENGNIKRRNHNSLMLFFQHFECMSIMAQHKIVYLRYNMYIDCVHQFNGRRWNHQTLKLITHLTKKAVYATAVKLDRGVGIDVDVVVSFSFYLSNKFLTIPKTYLCRHISSVFRPGHILFDDSQRE